MRNVHYTISALLRNYIIVIQIYVRSIRNRVDNVSLFHKTPQENICPQIVVQCLGNYCTLQYLRTHVRWITS